MLSGFHKSEKKAGGDSFSAAFEEWENKLSFYVFIVKSVNPGRSHSAILVGLPRMGILGLQEILGTPTINRPIDHERETPNNRGNASNLRNRQAGSKLTQFVGANCFEEESADGIDDHQERHDLAVSTS